MGAYAGLGGTVVLGTDDGVGDGSDGGGGSGGGAAVVGRSARNAGKRNSCYRSRYFTPPTHPFYITLNCRSSIITFVVVRLARGVNFPALLIHLDDSG